MFWYNEKLYQTKYIKYIKLPFNRSEQSEGPLKSFLCLLMWCLSGEIVLCLIDHMCCRRFNNCLSFPCINILIQRSLINHFFFLWNLIIWLCIYMCIMCILLLKIIITAYFCLHDQQMIITISLFYDDNYYRFQKFCIIDEFVYTINKCENNDNYNYD